MCEQLRPEWNLVFTSGSIAEAQRLFEDAPEIHLALCDIELNDGLVFPLLRQLAPEFPVIFVTAYDEYALDAFKLESIDYLVKPLEMKALERAFIKYERIEKRIRRLALDTLARLEAAVQRKNYISRLLISTGEQFSSLSVPEVAWFRSEDKYVVAITHTGLEYIISVRSLNELEPQLDPTDFFRLSREIIASHKSIRKVSRWFKGKLMVKVSAENKEKEVTVSNARRNDFLAWFGQ